MFMGVHICIVPSLSDVSTHVTYSSAIVTLIVKLRQGSGKDWQGMAVKAKGVKALTLA